MQHTGILQVKSAFALAKEQKSLANHIEKCYTTMSRDIQQVQTNSQMTEVLARHNKLSYASFSCCINVNIAAVYNCEQHLETPEYNLLSYDCKTTASDK